MLNKVVDSYIVFCYVFRKLTLITYFKLQHPLNTKPTLLVVSYGTGPQLGSLPARSRPSASVTHSLDGSCSPRVQRLAHDIDSLQKERDDLHQQVGILHHLPLL